MTELKRPLIILGSVRSGTTLLGSFLRCHPDVAYWEEPKHIWRHRHAYRRHDVLTAADVTPAIRKYIHSQFGRYLAKSGKKRFVEKTPSNCMRVPFIRDVFPDAQFIHLIRDGRAASVSAMIQWRNDYMVPRHAGEEQVSTNTSYAIDRESTSLVDNLKDAFHTMSKFVREKRLLTGGIWFLLETPAYLPALLRVFGRKLTADRSFLWGPRFPGMRELHRTMSPVEVCALQWLFCVQYVRLATQDLPADRYLEIRYEDLIENPVEKMQEILSFANLPDSERLVSFVQGHVHSNMGDNWRKAISDSEMLCLQGWLGPFLHQLGYD